ncbi:CDP-alcohol phosphatidyltransferase family protein [Phreatobacter aquaticus]|uniref:CDP-alcohol phosphatidyltransferase family protein n=1 Tax=Phreatobacter aquaticus TaxID=2570229 RepID=A0A4D7QKE8_9HYPH|nr:CDP-alcohol phosphatidyltransferase family protein [Phreatobacter aquaticus]QCK85796.1 CDP-alcohol phosphatidyltransferase family protein [Phreatobacter aquaticus]
MFDVRLRRLIDPVLDRAGSALAARGVRADHLTMAGLAVGLAAGLAIALQAPHLALVLILANRLLDGLDGAVARASHPTDAGGFLDITADFLFYGIVPFAFAVADPAANGLPAAALLASFYVNGSAFLAFAVLTANRPGLGAAGQKSFHYLWGLAEGAETIAFFVLMVLFPSAFALLAWIFAVICLASGLARIVSGYRAARAQSSSGGKT